MLPVYLVFIAIAASSNVEQVQDARTIQSLCLLENADVLASTRLGIYRSQGGKGWQKMRFPITDTVPLIFSKRQAAKGPVFAYVPREYFPPELWKPTGRGSIKTKRAGLYQSLDSGNTWALVNNAVGFHSLYHFGPDLFALEEAQDARNRRVLKSKDLGRTWADLTNPPTFGTDIFPDPHHPGLVCVQQLGLRMYILQAQDENYNWRSEREGNARAQRRKEPVELLHYSVHSGMPFRVGATLDNYFRLAFGPSVWLPGYRLELPGSEVKFNRGAQKLLRANLRFLVPGQSSIALDNRSNWDLWSLSIRKPSGEYVVRRPLSGPEAYTEVDSGARKEWAEQYRKDHELTSFALREGERMSRVLDLDAVGPFSEVGTYEVRVVYDSGWLQTGDVTAYSEAHEFIGSIWSPPISVTITP